MTVEYSKLNSIILAQPPHHGRPRLNAVIVEADGYPVASTTNQRRRCAHNKQIIIGNGKKQISIRRKTGKDANGIATWAPVGIWRGFDPRLVRGYNEKYNGANLRKIRAIKGVGRPCAVP